MGDSNIQSILFKEDIEVLVAGISGVDCVLSGLAVTGGVDMTPAIAKGAVLTNRVLKAIAAADVTITAADATNPRIDLIVVNSSGALAVRAGTAAAAPKPPARTANDVVLWQVYVPANDTAIATTQCIDRRVTPSFPLCIYRTTAQEVTNTTAAAIHILDKTNSGVSIPSGLLADGRLLRVSLGGDVLLNNTTPTSTIAITFGGTTYFSDVTAASAIDADRRAWNINFVMAFQSTTVNKLVGDIKIQVQAAAVSAPTTGIAGEIGGTTGATASIIAPFKGIAGTVDTDAANRVLAVTWTFNVSHASNEMVVAYATVELL